jgi:hypothetical protein
MLTIDPAVGLCKYRGRVRTGLMIKKINIGLGVTGIVQGKFYATVMATIVNGGDLLIKRILCYGC